MDLVFDIEANGLFNAVSRIWCVAAVDPETREGWHWGPDDLSEATDCLRSADLLIGHNIIAYDLPALWTVLGAWDDCPLIFDTLITSRFLWPERPGGHGLESWGERLGYAKQEHDEWHEYSPEMLERCKRDVELNVLVKEALEEEHGATIPGFRVYDGDSIQRAIRRA